MEETAATTLTPSESRQFYRGWLYACAFIILVTMTWQAWEGYQIQREGREAMLDNALNENRSLRFQIRQLRKAQEPTGETAE